MQPVPENQGVKSRDGSTVKLTWLDNGAHAVVHILREKGGATFRMSREEARVLRHLLPARQPDVAIRDQ